MNEKDLLRFAKKWELGPGGCWLWTGGLSSSGYGMFSLGGKSNGAHRVIYEHYYHPIPDTLVVDHLCNTKHCVNPAHLNVVTPGENLRRGKNANRDKTHCPSGHEYTPENTYIRDKGRRVCKQCLKEKKVARDQRARLSRMTE